jgi:Rrf2 family protein
VILSQKSQYGVRAVLELAKRYGSGLVPAAKVAEFQFIPLRFLENILGQLRQAGIVESVRGKEGGYRLSRPPGEVTVGDVIRPLEGPIAALDCDESAAGGGQAAKQCPLRAGCVLLPMWDRAHRAMMDVFDGTTFDHLVEQERTLNENPIIDFVI